MLDIYADYATDEKSEVEGVWKTLKGNARVKVARMGNTAYSKALNKEYQEHKEALDREDEAADLLNTDIMVRVYARTILMDWENIGMKGQLLSYNIPNAETLLRVKDFRQAIFALASKVDDYRVKVEAEQGKA